MIQSKPCEQWIRAAINMANPLKNKEIILKIMGSVNGQYSANNRDAVFGIPIKTALDFPNQWWWNAHYFFYINCGSIYGFIRIFFNYTKISYNTSDQIHLRTRPRQWNYTQKYPDIIQKINLKSHEDFLSFFSSFLCYHCSGGVKSQVNILMSF